MRLRSRSCGVSALASIPLLEHQKGKKPPSIFVLLVCAFAPCMNKSICHSSEYLSEGSLVWIVSKQLLSNLGPTDVVLPVEARTDSSMAAKTSNSSDTGTRFWFCHSGVTREWTCGGSSKLVDDLVDHVPWRVCPCSHLSNSVGGIMGLSLQAGLVPSRRSKGLDD